MSSHCMQCKVQAARFGFQSLPDLGWAFLSSLYHILHPELLLCTSAILDLLWFFPIQGFVRVILYPRNIFSNQPPFNLYTSFSLFRSQFNCHCLQEFYCHVALTELTVFSWVSISFFHVKASNKFPVTPTVLGALQSTDCIYHVHFCITSVCPVLGTT